MIKNIAPVWYEIAQKEHGETEIKGNKHNDRIIQYHQATSLKALDDETAWCASFINWCLKEGNITYTNSAAAISFEKYGIKVARNQLQVGDIVVFKRGSGKNASWQRHVGFFAGQRRNINGQDQILILGGNQSNKVSYQWYSVKRITAIRRPSDWQEEAVSPTNIKPLKQSKTLAGIGIAGGAAMASELIEKVDTISTKIDNLSANSFWQSGNLTNILLMVVIAGLTLSLYARISDRRKGLN